MAIRKRIQKRVNLRIKCTLDLGFGKTYRGFTKNLSLNGARMESIDFVAPLRKKPLPRDVGLFSFFIRKGDSVETFKIKSRVVWARASWVGLTFATDMLTEYQQRILAELLESTATART